MILKPVQSHAAASPAARLLELARAAGADQADVMFVDNTDISCSCRLGRLEHIERAESAGAGLRVLVGRRQAMVSTSDLSPGNLKILAERAVSMARVAPEDPYALLAAETEYAQKIPDLDLCEKREPSPESLIDQARATEAAALAVKGISNSEGGEAGYSRNNVHLATSKGFYGSYARSYSSLSVSVLAGEGTGMQRDYAFSIARFLSDLESPETVGRKAAERTLRKLHSRKVKTNKVPVVFEYRVARALLGQFASAVNGVSVSRGTSFLKNKMGAQLFPKEVQIVDDPLTPRGLGSRPFDAEGIAGSRRAVIEDGVLKTWFLDLATAKQLDLHTTGHATRGLASAPNPSPSNFTLIPGDKSPEELISEIEEGFFVTEAFGMGVNLVTGDYSQGASGFWIEKGRLAYPVQEVTVAGHLLEMFQNLTPANDLIAESSVVSPSVRIARMTVAGA